MATRFYFTHTGSAPIQKTHFSPAWTYLSQWKSANLITHKMPTDINVGQVQGSTITFAAGQIGLDRQYWSPPLSGNQIINGTITACQLMMREFAANDDVNRIYTYMCLCNQTGGVRQQLLEFNHYGPAVELLDSGMRNKRLFTSGTSSYGSSGLISDKGDFIVIEIGYRDIGAGNTPQAAGLYGINSSILDCPIDETTTALKNGFLELSQDLRFMESILISDDE